jgi:hypothetical protein
MEPLTRNLTRDELATATTLGRRVVDALVNSGTLNAARNGTIAAADAEALLRTALMGLYRAEAEAPETIVTRAATEPAADTAGEQEFEIERFEFDSTPVPAVTALPDTVSMLSLAAESEEASPDLRVAVRYVPRRQIGGTFNRVKFTIAQISNTGLRVRHNESLLPGEEARLAFALMKPPRTFVMRARVVWTSIAQRGGESFCISGLRVVDFPDRLREAVDLLREARELAQDATTDRTPSRAKSAGPLRDVTDDEVAAILKAVRHFAADPLDATRWYARARFAVADENIRRAASPRASDREQVLGIWEYLARRVDLQKIAAVVSWSRNIRTAAV